MTVGLTLLPRNSCIGAAIRSDFLTAPAAGGSNFFSKKKLPKTLSLALRWLYPQVHFTNSANTGLAHLKRCANHEVLLNANETLTTP
jgi:hypothetical protein